MALIFTEWFWPTLEGSMKAFAENTSGATETGSDLLTTEYNRLGTESSPYLLQHATNPIDWYPWGQEAFEKAKRENKLIFLSIGYSTCHWCHVMAHESFEDKAVAALLNQNFVSIKVDREERPDIDTLYMRVTQILTGHGGWPMTVILTPDRKPFFAGTYFPKNTSHGRAGLMEILPKLAQIWTQKRTDVLDSAERVISHMASLEERTSADIPGRAVLERAQEMLAESFDDHMGGFEKKPKFPSPHILTFLLRHYHRSGNRQSLTMLGKTLTQMRLGGIYDHLGFGFHRYATDSEWRVPHFEKMLYDQALLVMAYTEAYQITGKSLYKNTASEIATYIQREMVSSAGGFYSAQDADSEGEEGKSYLWTAVQIEKALGAEEAFFWQQVYNVKQKGNFLDEVSGRLNQKNILYLKKRLVQIAKEQGMPEDRFRSRLETIRKKLLSIREKRIQPFKDDKILTAWNGLMIAALAKSGMAFGEPKYLSAAQKAADFILTRMRDDEGRLLRRYRREKAGISALLNDYAFMVWGLIELYQATLAPGYLKEAIRLNDIMLAYFWDHKKGGLFQTASDAERLFMRSKQAQDGAIPSGNSVAALNLLRLSRLTGKTDYSLRAEELLKAFSTSVERYPAAFTHMIQALDYVLYPDIQIVVVGRPDAPDTVAMLKALQTTFLADKVLILKPADKDQADSIVKLAPYITNMTVIDGKATAYVCRDFVCNLPTTEISQMRAMLNSK